jgi:L-ascorbate metabolism protein UlaG (beta-lactamase superfamily)
MKRQSEKPSINITWYGHSAFLLESAEGKQVLIDPWLENPSAPKDAKDISNIDLILVTHGHSDHLGNTIDLAKRTNALVISIFEIFQFLQGQGIVNGQGMNKGGTVSVDGIDVTMVDAKHSSTLDVDGKPIAAGEPAGFIVKFENGYTVYHAGDTTVFGDMKIIGDLYKPDLALLPIGGYYTMGPKEAAYACKLLRPKRIIGMHYGTFPALSGTPAELRRYLPSEMKRRVVGQKPGEKISL